MKAEAILCLPQWGKVPSLSRRMRWAAAQRKRAASGSFLLCAEGTARPVSALPCPSLPRAADSDADCADVCRRRISIRQGGLPRKEKEPRTALFCSAPKAQPDPSRRWHVPLCRGLRIRMQIVRKSAAAVFLYGKAGCRAKKKSRSRLFFRSAPKAQPVA